MLKMSLRNVTKKVDATNFPQIEARIIERSYIKSKVNFETFAIIDVKDCEANAKERRFTFFTMSPGNLTIAKHLYEVDA